MKRGIKGMLIFSGAAFVVGLVLLITGFCLGATWSNIADTIVSGKYSFGSGWSEHWGSGNMEAVTVGEYDLKDVKKLIIHMEAGTLNIENGEANMLKLENDKDRGRLYVDVSGSVAEIRIKAKRWHMGAKATIWIPEDFTFDDVELDMDAGQVNIASITAKDLLVNMDAGQIIGNGEIKAENSTWDIDAGQIKAKYLDSETTTLECDAGSLEVTMTGKQSDYSIESKCDAGEIAFGDQKYHWGEQNTDNSGADRFIEADCDAGKIEIDFKEK